MTQSAQCFAFNLADALTGEAELLPDFFQRVTFTVLQAETQAQNTCLTRGECAEQFFNLFIQ